MNEKTNKTFEEEMKRLEYISEKIESGELSIEKSIELYSEAQTLITDLEEKIKHAKDMVDNLEKVDK
ncbi:MAG: exodeoxyribonuclease VII small subunit [Erysipelotrichaceae bacterium]|jgi:exodeoxyribonuclease VII small subunit|nr:exodeoxyribonuclease VII small subunit [Erysipelotrichaceae bacterium]